MLISKREKRGTGRLNKPRGPQGRGGGGLAFPRRGSENMAHCGLVCEARHATRDHTKYKNTTLSLYRSPHDAMVLRWRAPL